MINLIHRMTWKRSIIVTLVAMCIGGAAFAYWTTTGSGSGSAATGEVDPVVVNQTSTITGLAPGLGAQTLSGDFDNDNDNDGPVYVGSVSATVTGTNQSGCTASDYTIAGTAPVNAEVPAGDSVGSWSGLTIQFNNKPSVNQDACKGATVTLAYTSN